MSIQFSARNHRITTDFSQNTTGIDALTYSMWCRLTAAGSSVSMALHGTGGSGTTFVGPRGTVIFSAVFNNGGTPTTYTWTTVDTVQAANEDHHVCVVFDGTDSKFGAVIFIDGFPVTTTTTAPATGLAYYKPTGNWGLLNAVAGGGGAKAIFADVRLYSRALDPKEVATIYGQRGRDGILDSLLVRAMFDEEVPASVATTGDCIDISANKHTLTVTKTTGNIVYSDQLSQVRPSRGTP